MISAAPPDRHSDLTVTVARVDAELERAGILETRRGVGTFVTATPAQAHPKRDRDRRLNAFTTRVLAEAAATGIDLTELLDALVRRAQGE